MAYLVDIEARCSKCKTARATCELFNRRNGSCGKYCRPCGKKELKKQQEEEKKTWL